MLIVDYPIISYRIVYPIIASHHLLRIKVYHVDLIATLRRVDISLLFSAQIKNLDNITNRNNEV